MVLTLLLTLGVVIVNGWTDAPNAIASAVVTRAMRPGAAVLMASVMNFLGVSVTSRVNLSVVDTVLHIASFGGNTALSQIALSAAMSAIVLWAVLAWRFGIPTSESHALIAGLTGASVAVTGGFSGVGAAEWGKVLFGLGFSTVFGFVFGALIALLVSQCFRESSRDKTNRLFARLQILSAAASAFLHGAQDGQKFLGVFLLCFTLGRGEAAVTSGNIPLSLILFCSFFMSLGTALGGKRIIKAIGLKMVHIEKYQGFSADAASALGLLISTLFGVPVSTTHTKSTAMMGVAAARNVRKINWACAQEMLLAWVLTFPLCGLLAWLLTRVFLAVFHV